MTQKALASFGSYGSLHELKTKMLLGKTAAISASWLQQLGCFCPLHMCWGSQKRRDEKGLMKIHQLCTKLHTGMHSNGALLPAENSRKSPAANQCSISCMKVLQNHCVK